MVGIFKKKKKKKAGLSFVNRPEPDWGNCNSIGRKKKKRQWTSFKAFGHVLSLLTDRSSEPNGQNEKS